MALSQEILDQLAELDDDAVSEFLSSRNNGSDNDPEDNGTDGGDDDPEDDGEDLSQFEGKTPADFAKLTKALEAERARNKARKPERQAAPAAKSKKQSAPESDSTELTPSELRTIRNSAKGVKATQAKKFADPSDIDAGVDVMDHVDEDGYFDPDSYEAAIEDLLIRKPHLAAPRTRSGGRGNGPATRRKESDAPAAEDPKSHYEKTRGHKVRGR